MPKQHKVNANNPFATQLQFLESRRNKETVDDQVNKLDEVISALNSWGDYLMSPEAGEHAKLNPAPMSAIAGAVAYFVNTGDQVKFANAIDRYVIDTYQAGQAPNRFLTLLSTFIGAVAGYFAGAALGSLSGPGALVAGLKGAEIGAGFGAAAGGMLGYYLGSTFFTQETRVRTQVDLGDIEQTKALKTAVAGLFQVPQNPRPDESNSGQSKGTSLEV